MPPFADFRQSDRARSQATRRPTTIRGHVYYFKGDLANASDEIDKALAIDPNFPFSYFIRGLVRHAQGRREEATADFQKSSGFNFPYAVYWTWITQMEAGQLAHRQARTSRWR